jgi:hypothetical protein
VRTARDCCCTACASIGHRSQALRRVYKASSLDLGHSLKSELIVKGCHFFPLVTIVDVLSWPWVLRVTASFPGGSSAQLA